MTVARTLSVGLNGVGVALMVVVFSATGGITGGEAAVAGGTAAVSQTLLTAVFGEQALRDLVSRAGMTCAGPVRGLYARGRAGPERCRLAGMPSAGLAPELRRVAGLVADEAGSDPGVGSLSARRGRGLGRGRVPPPPPVEQRRAPRSATRSLWCCSATSVAARLWAARRGDSGGRPFPRAVRHGNASHGRGARRADGRRKSTLYNWLCGAELSTDGARRPDGWERRTGARGARRARLLDWLRIRRRHEVAEADERLDGLVLLDLPHFDSTVAAHR